MAKKNYYAVLCGYIAPAICTSWGVAQPLVSGYSGNKHKGFKRLDDAIAFMKDKGHFSHSFFRGSDEGERAPEEGDLRYYAVANGEHVGVYEYYEFGAQLEITKYSHACHKAFKSREEAEGFIKEYQTTAELVIRHHQDEDNAAALDVLMSQLRLEQ